MQPTENGIVSALTVDLEDYFQVTGFEAVVSPANWGNYESRVEQNTDRMLDILAEAKITATFFILGWTAERYPQLIRRIQVAGHELASHSYAHRLTYTCSRNEFREDTRRAKRIVEDISGQQVLGYRAPSFSITRNSLWSLEILAEEGFQYDSSIFPILRDRYGIPGAPRYPYRILLGDSRASVIESIESVELLRGKTAGNTPPRGYPAPGSEMFSADCSIPAASCQLPAASREKAQQLNNSTDSTDSRDSIVEFPPSTVRFFGVTTPIGGGGYLRLFPQWVFRQAVRHIVESEKTPAILYIHPWELDPDQPRFRDGSRLSRFRHYVNLQKTEMKLRSLLAQWRFAPLRDLLTRLPDIPVRSI